MNRFLPAAVCALVCSASFLRADDAKPMLVQAGKVISAPDFKQPLGPEWSVAKGTWEPKDGVLTVTDIPDQHHVPVLHLKTGPTSLVWECEFRLNSGKIFYVGCDGAKHIGRIVIMPKSIKVCEDSTENKATKTPSHTLAEKPVDLKDGEWQKLRVEYTGDQMTARLNDVEVKGQDEHLAAPKVQWWFAAGNTAEVRNVKISEGQPLTK